MSTTDFLLIINLVAIATVVAYKIGWFFGHNAGHDHEQEETYGDPDEN